MFMQYRSTNDTTIGDIRDSSDTILNSKSLKITLCFTPELMLLLLTSFDDEDSLLKKLYLTTALDLFDGVEMMKSCTNISVITFRWDYRDHSFGGHNYLLSVLFP